MRGFVMAMVLGSLFLLGCQKKQPTEPEKERKVRNVINVQYVEVTWALYGEDTVRAPLGLLGMDSVIVSFTKEQGVLPAAANLILATENQEFWFAQMVNSYSGEVEVPFKNGEPFAVGVRPDMEDDTIWVDFKVDYVWWE